MNYLRRYLRAAFSACTAHLELFWRRWVVVLILAAGIFIGYRLTLAPPADFPARSMVSFARGTSAYEIAEQLGNAHIVAHPRVLRFVLRISGQSGRVQAGTYLFDSPENALAIAYRIVAGVYGIPPVRLTFPEGETARDAAASIAEAFPSIPESDFLSVAQPYEGYLFPDTYLFSPSSDAESIVETMRTNFDTKIAPLLSEVQASGHSLSDIITMASLLEREARSSEARRMIAGILYNRLELGMPLQVDAVFGYIYGRDTYSPSFDDLKIDSPYNTYLHTGLPPGPIANPGLVSIEAALDPAETDFLYYLTGTDGLMHYAKTYAGHQANQRKYLP